MAVVKEGGTEDWNVASARYRQLLYGLPEKCKGCERLVSLYPVFRMISAVDSNPAIIRYGAGRADWMCFRPDSGWRLQNGRKLLGRRLSE